MKSFLTSPLHKDILAIKYGANLTNKQINSIKEKSLILYSEILWFILHKGDLYEFTSISFEYMDFYVGNWRYTKLIMDKFIEIGIIFVELNDRGTKSYSAGNGDGSKSFATKYKVNPKYFTFEENSIFNLELVSKDLNMFKGSYKHIEYIKHKVSNSSNVVSTYHITGKNSTKNSTQSLTTIEKNNDKKSSQILTKITNNMKKITVKPTVYEFIENYKINEAKILLNDEAVKMNIKNTIEFDEGYVGINWLYGEAKKQNKDFIVYKDKSYIETKKDFIERKSHNSQIHMLYTVETINSTGFYAKRNENNRRVDSTITNMKSELRDFLLIDGEETEELDIANAQFAILAYLYPKQLDKNFIELVKTGELYQYIGDKLYDYEDANQRKTKAKMLMIQTAFSKSEAWQNPLRQLFPKTMIIIDKAKEKDNKEFSKLLQNTESKIIIDDLLPKLMKKYTVFTIHDAFLVKKSEATEIKEFINKYFKSIGLECYVRGK